MPISTIGSNSLNQTSDLTINGQTVGKGGGNVATNTAHGVSALAANTTGLNNVAVGVNALDANTTASGHVAIGADALGANTTGARNTAVGSNALLSNTTGLENTAISRNALYTNSTGSYNTALGLESLFSNTTASNNTAVGYQAGYSNTTGGGNGGQNTFIGDTAGYSTTSDLCTFVGRGAGSSVTSGRKNTILGTYNGNQGGLDIRTASNRIVLSDGDGNPRAYTDDSYGFYVNSPTGNRYVSSALSLGTTYKSQIYWDNSLTNLYVVNASGGVYLTNTGTSWTSNSDERLKENLIPIENGLSKVCSLRSVIGNFIADETKKKTPFLIAQDVQAVLPEAVTTSTLKGDETDTEYLGVAYTEVIPLLVASIKELKALVDAQATEIAELKAKVA